MSENVIQIANLTKRYKTKTVLNILELRLEKGKIYGFIGQNGAGKTTLIRTLMGLSLPDSGHIEMFGRKDRKGLEQARKSIGCMIEHTALCPNFTARQNMILQCKMKGIANKYEVDRVLETVGLENTGKKTFKHFSMGMKQRLGIAAALIGDPKLLILDEPVNGLDPVGITEIREILTELNRRNGITILISSHILGELHALATDYVFIDQGEIIHNLSLAQLDEKCRKYTVIETDNIDLAKTVLHELGLDGDYQQTHDKKINISSAQLDTKQLASAFHNKGVLLTEMSHSSKTLEQFFLELVGGMQNDSFAQQ